MGCEVKAGPIAGSAAAARSGRFGPGAKDRENAASVAPSEPLPVEPPSWLAPAVAAIWRSVRPHVHSASTVSDTEMFASFCVATEHVRRHSKGKSRIAGEQVRSAQRIQIAIASALGLTPMSRARLPAVKPPDEKSQREATISALVR